MSGRNTRRDSALSSSFCSRTLTLCGRAITNILHFSVNQRDENIELFEVSDENLEHLEVGFGKFVDEIVDGRHS